MNEYNPLGQARWVVYTTDGLRHPVLGTWTILNVKAERDADIPTTPVLSFRESTGAVDNFPVASVIRFGSDDPTPAPRTSPLTPTPDQPHDAP